MAAKTTVKVATQTGAAKDDVFAAATTGLTEESLSASLNVLGNDPGAARLYSLLQSTSGLSPTAQFPAVTTATLVSGATIRINADQSIGYDASTLYVSQQSLALGETYTDSFTYTVRMANGALSTATVTVAIAGANDAPTLTGIEPASINDTAADDTPAAVGGTLAGADVDNGAVLSYGFGDGVAFAVAEDGKLVSTNAYGTISLDAQSGAYSFVADADAIDALAAGADASAGFAVQVSDEHGATSAALNLVFNLIGANDTAEIGGDTTATVAEDGTATASGTLTVSDRDAGQSLFQVPASLAGAFGDFSFDADTGAWSYVLRNNDADVQALVSGQTVFDELVITSLDGSASETISVAIGGADEAVAPPPVVEPVNLPVNFMVNNGLSIENNRATFHGFDENDRVVYSGNFTLTGFSNAVDTNGDSVADSSSASFVFKGNTVDVILVGYMDLTAAQILPTSLA